MKKKWKMLLTVLACLVLVGVAWAQVSPNFDLSWHVLGGGGRDMVSESYAMRSTLGQFAIGPADSESYDLGSGYWYGIPTTFPFNLYLPIVPRGYAP